MAEWWHGSRVMARGRWLLQQAREVAAGSATVKWWREWRSPWLAMERPHVIRLFTRGCLWGFVAVALIWGRTLTLRELIIRIAVLGITIIMVRRCAASADK